VATSYHLKLFKTEVIDDMPYEQFRVLVAMLNKMHKDTADNLNNPELYTNTDTKKKGHTTFRITDK
jgi:hypothetical protein